MTDSEAKAQVQEETLKGSNKSVASLNGHSTMLTNEVESDSHKNKMENGDMKCKSPQLNGDVSDESALDSELTISDNGSCIKKDASDSSDAPKIIDNLPENGTVNKSESSGSVVKSVDSDIIDSKNKTSNKSENSESINSTSNDVNNSEKAKNDSVSDDKDSDIVNENKGGDVVEVNNESEKDKQPSKDDKIEGEKEKSDETMDTDEKDSVEKMDTDEKSAVEVNEDTCKDKSKEESEKDEPASEDMAKKSDSEAAKTEENKSDTPVKDKKKEKTPKKKEPPNLEIVKRVTRSSSGITKPVKYHDPDPGDIIDDDDDIRITKEVKKDEDDDIEMIEESDPLAISDADVKKAKEATKTPSFQDRLKSFKQREHKSKDSNVIIIDTNTLLKGPSAATSHVHTAAAPRSSPAPAHASHGHVPKATTSVSQQTTTTSATSTTNIQTAIQAITGGNPAIQGLQSAYLNAIQQVLVAQGTQVSNPQYIATLQQYYNTLGALQDDAYVIEAPSFIVPYVMEGKPVESIKDYQERLKKEEEREEKKKKEEEKKKKEKEEKQRKEEEKEKAKEEGKEEKMEVDEVEEVKDDKPDKEEKESCPEKKSEGKDEKMEVDDDEQKDKEEKIKKTEIDTKEEEKSEEKSKTEEKEKEKEAPETKEKDKPRMEEKEKEKSKLEDKEKEKSKIEDKEKEKSKLEDKEKEKSKLEDKEKEKSKLEDKEKEKSKLEDKEKEKSKLEDKEKEKSKIEDKEKEKSKLEDKEKEKSKLEDKEKEKSKLEDKEKEKSKLEDKEKEKKTEDKENKTEEKDKSKTNTKNDDNKENKSVKQDGGKDEDVIEVDSEGKAKDDLTHLGRWESYYRSSLGKFFLELGLTHAQEFLQADLLKMQKRRVEKLKTNPTRQDLIAIKSLERQLNVSKAKNSHLYVPLKTCRFCSFKTESHLVMKRHLESPHMVNYTYKCNFCEFETRGPQVILFHTEAEHNVRGRLERAPAFFQCPLCPFEDNNKSKMTRHSFSCTKKFKADKNSDLSDWEPPAKIPKIHRGRPNFSTFGKFDGLKMPNILPKNLGGLSLNLQNAISSGLLNSAAMATANSLAGRGRGRPVGSYKNITQNIGSRPGSLMYQNRGTGLLQSMPGVSQQQLNLANQVLQSVTQGGSNRVPRIMPASSAGSLLPGLAASSSITIQSVQNKSGSTKSPQQPSISITPLPRGGSQGSGNKTTPTNVTSNNSQRPAFVICEICDGYIKDLEQLRNHMNLIHKVKIHPKMIYNRPPLNCQKCQHRFFTDQGLERHLLGTHGLVTSSMQEAANKGKDAGRCPICGKVFQWKLLNHVSRDHKMTLKPAHLSYKCTVCTATFNMYRLFENHVYSAHSVVNKNKNSEGGSSSSTSTTPAKKPTPVGGSDSSTPLKINDEITIIPQPATKSPPKAEASKTSSSSSSSPKKNDSPSMSKEITITKVGSRSSSRRSGGSSSGSGNSGGGSSSNNGGSGGGGVEVISLDDSPQKKQTEDAPKKRTRDTATSKRARTSS